MWPTVVDEVSSKFTGVVDFGDDGVRAFTQQDKFHITIS